MKKLKNSKDYTKFLQSILICSLLILIQGCTPLFQWSGSSNTQVSRDYWPTKNWRTSIPEEQDMDSRKLNQVVDFIEKQNIAIDSLIVVRHGYIVLEKYWNGYDASTRHHLQSATKSVSSTLIGIAIEQGLIAGVDVGLIDLFPEHTIENIDQAKQEITLQHLLTMSDGMDWHELDLPYNHPGNSLGQMWGSVDAVQHVLNTPMARQPGLAWNYNSGTSILLGGIIEEASGGDVPKFAHKYLFDPIGIGEVEWSKTPGGHTFTDGGLYMTPRDMARFGYLMLNNGAWDDKQIVASGWVQQASQSHYAISESLGYGYQWWTLPKLGGYRAHGHYGQSIYVLPEADMVVVFTANIPDSQPEGQEGLLYQFILEACDDLPVMEKVQGYNRYGIAYSLPAYFVQYEGPIPGKPGPSEESGIVQFTFDYYPMEIISIVWETPTRTPDVTVYLDDLISSLSEQTGAVYLLGQRSFDNQGHQQGGHKMTLQNFETIIQNHRFFGFSGAWYCPESDRIYVFNYSTDSELGEAELKAKFQAYLNAFSCSHGD